MFEAVGEQVDADDEQRDGGDGKIERPGRQREIVAVLVDHETPIGVGRLDADAQEAERLGHEVGEDRDQERFRYSQPPGCKTLKP